MCVFIFSPGKTIDIVYASETISFLRKVTMGVRPLSEVVLDLLIKNKAETDVGHLYLIYPRAFYKSEAVKERGKPIFRRRDVCSISDQTATFLEAGHRYNVILNSPPP